MGRRRLVLPAQVQAAWTQLVAEIGRRPSSRQFAAFMGISPRTAWRYLRDVTEVSQPCPHCNGTGVIGIRGLPEPPSE